MMNISSNIAALNGSFYSLTSQAPKVEKSNAETLAAKEAAQDFEAFFLTRMMESMFDGISTNGPFGGGEAEKMYRSLLLDEYGKEIAKLGGIGVQDQVMRAILEMQEMNEKGFIEKA